MGLALIIETIQKNGLEAALKYCNDEDLMLKVSAKMGGVPADLRSVLQNLDGAPVSLPSEAQVSLHEACKTGNVNAVQNYLAPTNTSLNVDATDAKGITSLGYAIGSSHLEIVQMLLEHRADAHAVDGSVNSGLHYAAGYGRKEM